MTSYENYLQSGARQPDLFYSSYSGLTDMLSRFLQFPAQFTSTTMSHDFILKQLTASLQGLQTKQISVNQLCGLWRQQQDLLTTLPPRYTTVLEDLLNRLEAGSLFSEESCSFSQVDLLDNLQVWLTKAAQHLTPPSL